MWSLHSGTCIAHSRLSRKCHESRHLVMPPSICICQSDGLFQASSLALDRFEGHLQQCSLAPLPSRLAAFLPSLSGCSSAALSLWLCMLESSPASCNCQMRASLLERFLACTLAVLTHLRQHFTQLSGHLDWRARTPRVTRSSGNRWFSELDACGSNSSCYRPWGSSAHEHFSSSTCMQARWPLHSTHDGPGSTLSSPSGDADRYPQHAGTPATPWQARSSSLIETTTLSSSPELETAAPSTASRS